MRSAARNIVISPALRELFEHHWRKHRVVYFGAPCGMGKTVSALEMLVERKICAYSALDPDGLTTPVDSDCEAVLIDDIQNLTNESDRQTLCAWINENPEKHFVLLGRGPLPGYLLPYRFTGMLGSIETMDLLFSAETVKELFSRFGVDINDAEARGITSDAGGYPLLVAALGRRMGSGVPYGKRMLDAARGDMYHSMEEAVYRRFSVPMRRLLLALMPFERFNAEIATLASGDSHINDLLKQMLRETSMTDSKGPDDHRF